MDPKGAQADAAVAEIAGRQHGVATLTQLNTAGLSATQIKTRVRSGRLHRIHRGVYAVGHSGLSDEGRRMAAVLACGLGVALSHRTAAEHWKLLPPSRGAIDVTVATRAGRRRRTGVRIHRSHLPSDATLILDGIRVTTPARTLRDLRSTVPPEIYRRSLRQAEYLGRNLSGLHTDGTRSDPEAHFLRLCRRHRLPAPDVNVRIGPFTVDFLWRERSLVIEVDAWSTHRGRQAFEDDHERDVFLAARGYRVLRFTDRQIARDPASIAGFLRAELASGRMS